MTDQASVDLYWLPLGAGGHSVRLNGRVYEFVAARYERRRAHDLYHSALIVRVDDSYVVEQAPVRDGNGRLRGVVLEGPVVSSRAARWRVFRYELRCWRGGVIPDVDEAIESPVRLTTDPLVAHRILELAPAVPPLTWGRDESDAGEMWNSNSVISWLLVRSGVDVSSVRPPAGGRAPGWDAGVALAHASRCAGNQSRP